MKEKEDELSLIAEKVHNSLSDEDLLQDSVIETTFPSIRRLLKIYVLIPMSEAIAERVFSKMGQIVTKKRTALGDNRGVLDKWKKKKDRRIFAYEF